jgi:hypothetical protein
MTESEVLQKINAIEINRDSAVLAGYWLLMGSRYDVRLFTLNDLRSLTGESRTLFYAINEGYASQRFSRLEPSMATLLMAIVVGYEHESESELAR